jgi:hypothetical protein
VTSFYLMVHADGKLHGGTFDRDEAMQGAALAGGVAVELPIVADFRGGGIMVDGRVVDFHEVRESIDASPC